MVHNQQPAYAEHIERELLRALRGKRSQSQLSRRLGYTFNQVYLWESGRRNMSWAEFARLCEAIGAPLPDLLNNYFTGATPDAVMPVLLKLKDRSAFTRSLGISPSYFSRLRSGKLKPSLRLVLQSMQMVQADFFEFLDRLAGPGKIDSIQADVRKRQSLSASLNELPYLSSVTAGLSLKSYQELPAHARGHLASRLGLTLEEEDRALQALSESGQVTLIEGKYRCEKPGQAFSRQPESAAPYWIHRAEELAKANAPQSAMTTHTFGLSQEGFAKLKEAHNAFLTAVAKIAESETKAFDQVVAVNVQMLTLAG